MERQRDWHEFFDQMDRQREARSRLIEDLDTDNRVKVLLHALIALSDDDQSSKRLHNGTVTLSIPLSVIAWKLQRSENTTKSYIDLAGSTPFLAVSPSKHRSHTYIIRWQAIVDGGLPDNEMTVRGCKTAESTEGAKSQARGSIRGSKRGSIRGSTAPQLTPNSDPLNTPGFKTPGFQAFESKNPGFKPRVLEGGQRRIFPPGFWPWWRKAVDARRLSNPYDVDELYALGVWAGLYEHSERNRFNVFAQAAHDLAQSQSTKALFRENVAYARWYATCAEEDHARLMMAQVDADDGDLPVEDPPDVEAIDRQSQMERLQTAMVQNNWS